MYQQESLLFAKSYFKTDSTQVENNSANDRKIGRTKWFNGGDGFRSHS